MFLYGKIKDSPLFPVPGKSDQGETGPTMFLFALPASKSERFSMVVSAIVW